MSPALLALTLGAVYVGAVLVVRVALHLRRTGTTGIALGRRSNPADLVAGLLLFAAAALGGTAPFLDLTGALPPVVPPTPWLLAPGVTLWVVGFALTFWSQGVMGASWRIGVEPTERTALVTAGPFGLVRNPIFTGMLLAASGLVLVLPSALTLPGWTALLVGLEVQVRLVEEPYLLRTHGAAYAEYAARVGRFLPGLGRLRAA